MYKSVPNRKFTQSAKKWILTTSNTPSYGTLTCIRSVAGGQYIIHDLKIPLFLLVYLILISVVSQVSLFVMSKGKYLNAFI